MQPQQKRRETQTLAQTAVNDCVWFTGDWKNGCSERNFVVGILSRITPVISYAGIRKWNAGLPSSVTAACSLFSSTVKRDHKMKRNNSGIFPAALAAHLGHFPLLFCFFFFFLSPVCRKRTASVCKCCYETRPHKCPSFSSPGNYLPTDILLNYTWNRFCSATVRHRPGSIHPSPSEYAHKTWFWPNARFHQVNETPARFAFFKISGLTFYFI